jgi:hypothetical protein
MFNPDRAGKVLFDAFQDLGERIDRRLLQASHADDDLNHPSPRLFEIWLRPPKPDHSQR